VLERLALPALILLLSASPAAAHKLKLFATAAGGRIEGSAYFVGSGPAAGIAIQVESAGGEPLLTLTTDASGAFAFGVARRADHVVIADAGEGHVARFTVPAAELAPAEPEADLAAVVDEAVARHVGPLRAQLDAYEARLRLHDVLGGLGWIAGLAGLAAWLQARRGRKAGP
jgi:nickel transport protein